VLARTASSISSDTDPDTIVVAQPSRAQLPTPSESSFDVSVNEAQVVSMKEVTKGRARRVSRRSTRAESQDKLVETAETETIQARTVSGETLVNMENASQSTLAKESIATLDILWEISQVFNKENDEDTIDVNTNPVEDVTNKAEDEDDEDDAEEERLRQERSAAKKAKMEENNKLWEKRRKAAEKHATRRSSRMPILDKASEAISSIANSVLGKRKATDNIQNLQLKKARVGSEPIIPKTSTKRREKKYLGSGLYAGQPRTFDMRLTESKNKRKSDTSTLPFKENWVLPLPMFAGERLLKQGRDFKLPFDIFSPLPPGQPKPDEWKKVNKNVFIGDAAHEWRENKFEEHSSCLCKPETGCDADCMNRYMYYECDSRNCNLTPEQCGNRAFEGLKQRVKKGGKYNVGVEVIKTEDRGYGVRSNRTFEANQIIVEYTGEIITQEECEKRMHTMYKDNEVSSFSFPPNHRHHALTTFAVLLSDALRPKHDHRRHPRFDRALRQPLLRPQL
jgi:[histone H3]-lysine4 N-trimethyltransferase ASH1L